MNRLACLFGPCAAAIAIAVSQAPPAWSQPVASAPAAADETGTVVLLDSIRQRLRERYVLPETGTALAEALTRAQAAGRFAGLSGGDLAKAVTAAMREVTPDGHLMLMYNPEQAAELIRYPEGGGGEDPVSPEQVRAVELNNGGVRKLEVLPGNIRYMEYTGFMWDSPAAADSITNAMQFLRGGSAAIIDLRRNGGGSPGAVEALTSYFVPAGTPLTRFEMRGRSEQPTVAGATPFTLAGKPVYVLTSKQTFSAAEGFAAHVDAFGFGTLIGETTGGGGFRNDLFAEPGGFVLSVSVGQAIQLKSGRGWERTGIAPDIAVPADNALDRARVEAIAALIPGAPEGERQAYEQMLPVYRALADGTRAARPAADYAGTYGDRIVALDAAGSLTSRRNGQPAVRLVPLGGDLFAPETSPSQRFRFVGESKVEAVEIAGRGGQAVRTPRTAG